MSLPRFYKIAADLRQTCNQHGISPARVLARSGLPSDYLEIETKGVDGETYFNIWDAIAAETDNTELSLTLGRGIARGPFQPALLAFSASPDIHTGLKRLALFKPLCAPIRLIFDETPDQFNITFSSEGCLNIPDIYAVTEIIFFLDLMREFTAHHIVPTSVELPTFNHVTPAYKRYVGAPIKLSNTSRLTLQMQDARRPLISADTEFYKVVEQELQLRLHKANQEHSIGERVRRAVIELLPSGAVSSDQVSARIGMSKRSLQRKLKQDDTSFQSILDETRASLALTYLREQRLSAEETSYLLAYQDPNSFYRAFHDWTGMTPAQARDTVVS
ncbi:AraC family transcriptional regulator [Amylibacter ulvae]|uniref:AraC family transcriptional regulator n=1 Tax=Paramylibacter ulvae TaxID=1651968 RepID=A0ABQ3CX94_9RHOB|nr:AraC family transcriptional regulator [Amylibacter ulvae]GHA42987.1 AraC family transcriptional regulator [Amylibacter ulvae]